MTTVDQSLINAIRVVVGEAVAPLGEKIDVLTERVDVLTERVDGLTERVDRIETEQLLQRQMLYSMQEGIDERFTALTERVDGLTEHVDTLGQRMDDFSERLHNVEIRLISIEDRVGRIEEIVERLELRTSQQLRELFELQDRMERGFASTKSETTLALKDIGTLKQTQQADHKKIRQLEKKVAALQQRLDALENAQAASSQ